MKNKKANLILLGAGPGDPELLTIKGLKAIQSADVILYDSLVNTKILDLAPKSENQEIIFVGKRRGTRINKQEDINELILRKLREGKRVLRLKGGDPFIFARGVEEVAYANEYGYEAEVIPGLTSGIAAPVSLGIALTLRGKSDSISLATAHDLSAEKMKLWLDILNNGSTLVVYMGLFKIVDIVGGLRSALDDDFPAIAIQDGTLTNEKIVISNLGNLTQDIIDNSLKSPVILVFGKYVNQNLEIKKPARASIPSENSQCLATPN